MEIQIPLPGFHTVLFDNYLGSGRHKTVYDLGPCVLKTAQYEYSKPEILREVKLWQKANKELRKYLAPIVAWAEDGSWSLQVKCDKFNYTVADENDYSAATRVLGKHGVSDLLPMNLGILNGQVVAIDYSEW
jgi:hypothetical protein